MRRFLWKSHVEQKSNCHLHPNVYTKIQNEVETFPVMQHAMKNLKMCNCCTVHLEKKVFTGSSYINDNVILLRVKHLIIQYIYI